MLAFFMTVLWTVHGLVLSWLIRPCPLLFHPLKKESSPATFYLLDVLLNAHRYSEGCAFLSIVFALCCPSPLQSVSAPIINWRTSVRRTLPSSEQGKHLFRQRDMRQLHFLKKQEPFHGGPRVPNPALQTKNCRLCTHHSWWPPGSTSISNEPTCVCQRQRRDAWLIRPHPPTQHLAAHLKSTVLWMHPFSRRWASQDSAQQSRAEGSLAVPVLVQNQRQISNSETLSEAPSEALRSTEWNIDGSRRCKLSRVCCVCMGGECVCMCMCVYSRDCVTVSIQK